MCKYHAMMQKGPNKMSESRLHRGVRKEHGSKSQYSALLAARAQSDSDSFSELEQGLPKI
jgi:hypothetical protein